MAVYLLHLDPPVGHSRHYIGYSDDRLIHKRLADHRAGRGGALPREALRRGSALVLVYVWWGADRAFERRLKRQGGAVRWCPACGVGARPVPQPGRPGRVAPDTAPAAPCCGPA